MIRIVISLFVIAITVALAVASNATWRAESLDYLQRPVATAPASRWYTLAELGYQGAAAALNATATGVAHLSDDAGILDLSDRACFPALRLLWDRNVLRNSEQWEGGIETGKDIVGYPSMVKNVHGAAPDGRYYLFYAIHDPYSGIALAVADKLDGTFHKLSELEPGRADSRVLRAPKQPRKTSHFSSPVVVWNPTEQLWFMYFHYYLNQWDEGLGHQRTALAVTRSLASHQWTPWTDAKGRLIAVLPTTHARWMNSQSTYHGIMRLSNGTWLAFLRGVGGEYRSGNWNQDPSKLGFAVSPDGRRWAEVAGNPIINPSDGMHARTGVYRPQFIAELQGHLFLAWSESQYYDSNPQLAFGTTDDLRTIKPIVAKLPAWTPADGAMSTWRDGDKLYFIYGARQRAWQMQSQCLDQSEVVAH